MPGSRVPPGLPAHPHQLEVQEFDSYALIVDLRSAGEYRQDHLPGAVSTPWPRSGDPLRTAIRSGDAQVTVEPTVVSTEDLERGLPYALEARLAALEPGAMVLAYCDRGGTDSAELARTLQVRGVAAEHLPGGWSSYRRWVDASIEVLTLVLNFRWLRSVPGGASQAVLATLQDRGLQVLPLAELLGPKHCPGLLLPGEIELTQAHFDTLLVDRLRRLDPARTVWVDEVLVLDPALGLPVPLPDVLKRSPALRLDVGLKLQAARLAGLLQGEEFRLETMLQALRPGTPAALTQSLDAMLGDARAGQSAQAMGVAMASFLSGLYDDLAPVSLPYLETPLGLPDLAPETVWAALSALPPDWADSLEPDPDQIRP